jgi:hypothetical protein
MHMCNDRYQSEHRALDVTAAAESSSSLSSSLPLRPWLVGRIIGVLSPPPSMPRAPGHRKVQRLLLTSAPLAWLSGTHTTLVLLSSPPLVLDCLCCTCAAEKGIASCRRCSFVLPSVTRHQRMNRPVLETHTYTTQE